MSINVTFPQGKTLQVMGATYRGEGSVIYPGKTLIRLESSTKNLELVQMVRNRRLRTQ